MTRRIELTRGKFALVSNDKFSNLIQYNWFAQRARDGKFYAATTMIVDGSPKRVYMHSCITGCELTTWINGDSLDNRTINLLECTRSELSASKKSLIGLSGYRGVTAWGKKYKASIKKDRILHYLGLYETAVEAARVYNKAAKELFGRFARLNHV